jgi:predicted nucleotidyltransferase
MTADLIVAEILKVIERLVTCSELRAHIFGSALHHASMWSDVDILIVCEVDKDGQLARGALSELCMLYPIDLVIMTSQEEVEFDFIRSENCQRIATSRAPPSVYRRAGVHARK